MKKWISNETPTEQNLTMEKYTKVRGKSPENKGLKASLPMQFSDWLDCIVYVCQISGKGSSWWDNKQVDQIGHER